MKKIAILSVILIWIFFISELKAQTPEIDSLENLLVQHIKNDTAKVNLLNKTADKLYRNQQNKSLQYLQESQELAESLLYKKGISESLHIKGKCYWKKEDYPAAIEYTQKGLKIFKEIDDKQGIAKAYNNIGFYSEIQGNYEEALKCHQKSLETEKELGSKQGIAQSLNNIGNIYKNQGNYPQSLEYHQQSLKIKKEINDKIGTAYSLNNIGNIFREQASYSQALEYHQKSLKIKKEIGEKQGIANSLNNIGEIHDTQGNYYQALEYYQRSLKIRKDIDDKQGIAYTLNNIGNMYMVKSYYSEALDCFHETLEISTEIDYKRGISFSYYCIANIYNLEEQYRKSLAYYRKALKISNKIGEKPLTARCYSGLASLYLKLNRNKTAYGYSKKAYAIATETGNVRDINESSEILAKSSSTLGLYKEAYKYYIVFKTMNDSMYNAQNVKKITGLEFQYKYEQEKQVAELEQQKKNAVRAKEEALQKLIRNSFIGGFLLMLILVVVVFGSFLQKRRANNILTEQKIIITETNEELNQTNGELNTILKVVNQQKREITAQHTKIIVHRDELEKQNKHITDSINYAKRIQTAVLPSANIVERILPEHFILFKPLDIVSGDFYWIQKINKHIIIAVADCTGHGVPGAFMSMLGISFLNEIVQNKKVQKASHILEELRNRIKTTLYQTGKYTESKDGMDMAIYSINTETNELGFSGAYNSLYIFRNDKLIELKANKQPIGIHFKETPFTNHKFILEKGDTLYTFSDGYADQVGGEKERKFLLKKFKVLLSEIQSKNMQEQKLVLEQTFTDWQGNYKQIDDVLIIGIRI